MSAMQPTLKSTALALAVGVSMAFAVGTAEASTIYVQDGNGGSVFGAAGSQTLTILVDKGAGLTSTTVNAGAFYLQYSATNAPYAWTDFITYCLEPDELLNVAGIVSGDYKTTLAGASDYAAKAAALTGLYATYFADSLTSSLKTAAFQVALWEVAYDTGNNLSGGSFQLSGSNDVRAQANAYLTNWISGAEPGVIVRVGSQDLLMSPTNVPEPAAMALFGAGLLGLVAIRRRRTV